MHILLLRGLNGAAAVLGEAAVANVDSRYLLVFPVRIFIVSCDQAANAPWACFPNMRKAPKSTSHDNPPSNPQQLTTAAGSSS